MRAELKAKMRSAAVSTVVLLGLSVMGALLILWQTDRSERSELIRELRSSGSHVKEVYDTRPGRQSPFAGAEWFYSVDGHVIQVLEVKTPAMLQELERLLSNFQNPLIDYTGIPHMYRKGDWAVIYVGNEGPLTERLSQFLGPSLVNG